MPPMLQTCTNDGGYLVKIHREFLKVQTAGVGGGRRIKFGVLIMQIFFLAYQYHSKCNLGSLVALKRSV